MLQKILFLLLIGSLAIQARADETDHEVEQKKGIWTSVKDAANSALEKVKKAGTNLKDKLAGAINSMKHIGGAAKEKAAAAIKDVVEFTKQALKWVQESIKNFIDSKLTPADSVKDTIENCLNIRPLLAQIKNKLESTKVKIQQSIDNFESKAKTGDDPKMTKEVEEAARNGLMYLKNLIRILEEEVESIESSKQEKIEEFRKIFNRKLKKSEEDEYLEKCRETGNELRLELQNLIPSIEAALNEIAKYNQKN